MFLPDSLEKSGMFPFLYRLLILFLGDASKTENYDIVPYLKLPYYIASLSWMLAGNVKPWVQGRRLTHNRASSVTFRFILAPFAPFPSPAPHSSVSWDNPVLG